MYLTAVAFKIFGQHIWYSALLPPSRIPSPDPLIECYKLMF